MALMPPAAIPRRVECSTILQKSARRSGGGQRYGARVARRKEGLVASDYYQDLSERHNTQTSTEYILCAVVTSHPSARSSGGVARGT